MGLPSGFDSELLGGTAVHTREHLLEPIPRDWLYHHAAARVGRLGQLHLLRGRGHIRRGNHGIEYDGL